MGEYIVHRGTLMIGRVAAVHGPMIYRSKVNDKLVDGIVVVLESGGSFVLPAAWVVLGERERMFHEQIVEIAKHVTMEAGRLAVSLKLAPEDAAILIAQVFQQQALALKGEAAP